MGTYRKSTPIKTTELCSKGCGNKARFKSPSGILLCERSANACPIIKKKNSDGVKQAYKDGRKDCSHLDGKRGWAKGLTAVEDNRIVANVKYDPNNIWGKNKKGPHKKLLLKERGHICESCGNSEWMGKRITIEMDHINGDRYDNRKENLQLLCPNCHSQTETWKKGQNGKRKCTDKEIIEAWNNSDNMNQTLNKLNYNWGSVHTVKRVLHLHKLI